jgi:hypothetical protein
LDAFCPQKIWQRLCFANLRFQKHTNKELSVNKLFVVFFGLLAMKSVAHAEPQSYPMVCRGGPNMVGEIATGSGRAMSFVYFQRGQQASSAGVLPGHCTWIDRGVGANEPAAICQQVTNARVRFTGNSLLAVQPGSNSYLGDIGNPNRNFIVQVYNDGAGCMRVTRVGP